MKKSLILPSLILCTALASCSTSNVTNSRVVEPTEEYEEEIIPTERVRDIVASDSFEYEVLDKGTVITKYTGSDTDVVVPDTLGDSPVVEIGFYAFEACYDITSVTLPESVSLICEGAFMDCSSLQKINIPEAVTGIERGAFVACTSLTELTVPANVGFINEEAFTACESLLTLTINNPDLAYESWGIEELPDLKIVAPEGSAVYEWASAMGKV